MEVEKLLDKDFDLLIQNLDKVEDINAVVISDDGYDLNYLHICVSIESPNRNEAVKFLLKKTEVRVNQPSGRSNDCWTALHIAASAGFYDTLQQLLENNGDPYCCDSKGLNVWDIANEFGNYSCIEVIEKFSSQSLLSSLSHELSISIRQKDSIKIESCDVFYIDSLTKIDSIWNGESDSSQETVIYTTKVDNNNCETKIYVDKNPHFTFVERKKMSVDLNDNVKMAALTCAMIEERRAKLGLSPVPITPTTRSVYAKQLLMMENNISSPSTNCAFKFSEELHFFINNQDDQKNMQSADLEIEFQRYFNNFKSSKNYFTYILLDPRITKNLQSCCAGISFNPRFFKRFLKAIFYIGKGQKCRPLQHLFEARKQSNNCRKNSDKVSRILDIWSSGRGVVSLHCFHNITSDEALSREFCMIAAIRVENLTNVQVGNNKLRLLKWNDHKKKLFGASLLLKAYFNILIEGEREIRPADMKN